MGDTVIKRLVAKLVMDTGDFARQASEAGKQAKDFGDRLSHVGKIATGVLLAGLLAVITTLVSIGAIAFKTSGDFQKATAAIIVGTGAAGESLAEMERIVKNLSGTSAGLGRDFGELGKVVAELNTRTGATGEELEELSRKILLLARLTDVDAVGAVANVTRVFGDWDIATEDQSHSLDILFEATQRTGIGLDRLTTLTVQYGAPLRQLGFTFEEGVSLMGKWEREGVNVETVMAGMRQAVSRFAQDNIEANEGLRDTISRITELGPSAEATALAIKIFGARAGPDMAAAILEGRFAIEDLVTALGESGGALDDAAERSLTMAEKFEIFRNRISLALLPLGDRLMGLVEGVLPRFEEAFNFAITVVDTFFGGLDEGLSFIEALWDALDLLGLTTDGLWASLLIADSAVRAFIDGISSGQPIIDTLWDVLTELGLATEGLKTFLAEADEVMRFLGGTISYLITEFISWTDILIALSVVIAVFVIPTVYTLLAPILAVIAVLVAVIAVVALVRNVWQRDLFGIRTVLVSFWEEHVRPIFQELREWLAVQIPIALAILSDFWENVLLPGLQVVWSWIEATLFPTLAVLWIWIKDTLTTALATLGDYWKDTLLPAIVTVYTWVVDTLLPLLATLRTWLRNNLTSALTTLSTFWKETLLPAVRSVWSFIDLNVIPLLIALSDVYLAAVGMAATILAGVWENVLWPAIKEVWKFVNENLIPIFVELAENRIETVKEAIQILSYFWTTTLLPAITTVWAFISEHLGPIFTWLADRIGDASSSIGGITGVIQTVIGWLNTLASKISSIKLPDWMTPGSPTPLEIGLRGVSSAMADLAQLSVPRLDTALGRMAPSNGAIHNYYLNGSYTYESEQSIVDRLRTLELLRG